MMPARPSLVSCLAYLLPLWLFRLAAWLVGLWHAQERRFDVALLWPACKREAERRGLSLNYARMAFAAHAASDPAWLALTDAEIRRRIDALA